MELSRNRLTKQRSLGVMVQKETGYKLLLTLTLIGLGVAVLSALESRVEWLASFCGLFGDGCRETESFTLFRIPVAYWGIGYYVLLALSLFFAKPLVFWLIMGGFGVELSLMWVLFSMQWVCVFCLLNFIVLVLLFFFSLDKSRFWQSATIVLLLFMSSHYLLSQENPSNSSVAAEQQDTLFAAKIGENESITLGDLETPIATRIYDLQTQIYQLKRERLDEMIDKVLLQKEADREQLPLQQFINERILSDNTTVTDEEVELYYRQNQRRWANWQGSQEELRSQIKSYLHGQKVYREIVDYARSVRDQYKVAVLLKEPPLPFTKVSIGDSPVLGSPDAPVTIVEFSDYLCPACRASHPVANQVKETYKDKVRWVFKDFPLERHKGAKELAGAARCAGEQGKFWEYQDLLFASEEEPDSARLSQYAEQAGLNVDRFHQCVESGKYASTVEQDIADARRAGVAATPTFIINGRLKPGGLSFEKFKEMIDEELEKAKQSSGEE